MKILVVCQHYYPEPFRITDICEELVKKGNEVTVITGVPNYPMGNTYKGYERGKKRDELINGVKVHRCFTIPRKHGIVRRVLNYYSFAWSSTRYAKKVKEEYDVVFVNQLSPVMMARAGIAYKKKHDTKLVIYCMDLWPESLKAGGIKENSLAFRHYFNVSNKIYRQADSICITSKSFEEYFLKNFNIDKKKIHYLPQYAEELFKPKDCEKKPNDVYDFMFAGNIGKAQSMSTIIEAAKILKNESNIRFHFVGDGSELDNIKKIVKEEKLNNIFFYGRKPIEEMPKYYKMADAMIVTLSGDSLISTTLPGKVQSYMAAGKPIIGSANGETMDVIRESKCGFCGKAESYKELSNNIRNFIKCNNKKELSNNAINYYNKHFKREIIIDNLINLLK